MRSWIAVLLGCLVWGLAYLYMREGCRVADVEPIQQGIGGTVSVDRGMGLDGEYGLGQRTSVSIDPDVPTPKDAQALSPVEIQVRLRRICGEVPGEGVPGVQVECERLGVSGVLNLGRTDSDGSIAAELPEPGRYRFLLDGDSIPSGLNPPGKSRTAGPNYPGVAEASYVASVEEGASIQLWLQESRYIRGYVVGPDGADLPGREVEVKACAPGLESVSKTFVTTEGGYFEFEGLYPFPYSLRLTAALDLDSSMDALYAEGAPAPPPQIIDLERGSVDDAWVQIRRGPFSVSGRVFDSEGRPFPNLKVLAYYYKTRVGDFEGSGYRYTMDDIVDCVATDSEGVFKFEGLVEHPIRVQVAPEEAASGGREVRLLARGPDVIDVDFAAQSQQEVRLADIVVTRSHTFEVRGRLALTAKRYKGKRLRTASMVIEGVFSYPPDHDSLSWGMQRFPHVEYDKRTGEFTASCDTPSSEIVLRVYPYGHEHLAREYRYNPIPDGTVSSEVLSYP